MGEITDQEQYQMDVDTLNQIAKNYPEYRRYLSHHLRNCLAAILNNCQLAIMDFDDPQKQGTVLKAIHQIKVSAEHIVTDLEKVGI